MATGLLEDEGQLLTALKAGDEAAFVALVEAWGPAMLRLARAHVSSKGVAEEVVQEAWLGILRGIDRFEGRSSVKTWAFRILVNNAKTRGVRESRSLPFSSADPEGAAPSVDPDRFRGPDDRWAGHWARPPEPSPEEGLLERETRDIALEAIAGLPPRQREIITLRDIEGFNSEEACNALGISETNQRVLLHRPLEGPAGPGGTPRTMTPMNCNELVELVTDYLEGRMPDAERSRFEAHLEECEYCVTYVSEQ